MKTPIIDGQSIDRFIPPNLRGMFFRHPMPQYKYAIHDGYAPYSFPTDGLVLYLPLWALKEDLFESVDAYEHACTVYGALWRPYGRYFDALDDHIRLGSPWSQSLANVNVYTVWGWARTSDITKGAVVYAEGGDTATPMIYMGIESSVAQFYHRDNAGNLANMSAAAGRVANDVWFHFAFVRRAANSFELYINTTSEATSSTNVGTTTVLQTDIGAKERTVGLENVWKGDIGEVGVNLAAFSDGDVVYNRNVTKWRYS